jgi:KDO2-lipid IV(A) lauroyltransferase
MTALPAIPRGGSQAISVRHLAEYALVRAFAAFAASLGPTRAIAAARRVGDLVRLVDRRHRRVAEENLAAALPERSAAERDRIVRECFRNLLRIGVELLLLGRVCTPRSYRTLFDVDSVDRLREIVGDRGIVFVTGHLGNWEVLGATLGLAGFPLHSVARPLDNPWLDRFLLRLRCAFGQTIVPKEGALRPLVSVLRSRGSLALVIDQDARRHGIFVDYFGRPASTIATPAMLGLRFGVPVVVGVCVRTGEGTFSFRLLLDEPIEVDPSAEREGEVRRVTAEINRRLESYVRAYPEQYLWQHRRWKTRPPEDRADGRDPGLEHRARGRDPGPADRARGRDPGPVESAHG